MSGTHAHFHGEDYGNVMTREKSATNRTLTEM